MFHEFPITVRIMTDDNAAVAHIVLHDNIIATGSSKRMPGDPRDTDLGIDLAVIRAFENYAKLAKEDLSL